MQTGARNFLLLGNANVPVQLFKGVNYEKRKMSFCKWNEVPVPDTGPVPIFLLKQFVKSKENSRMSGIRLLNYPNISPAGYPAKSVSGASLYEILVPVPVLPV